MDEHSNVLSNLLKDATEVKFTESVARLQSDMGEGIGVFVLAVDVCTGQVLLRTNIEAHAAIDLLNEVVINARQGRINLNERKEPADGQPGD